MRIKTFTIPVIGGEPFVAEMNAFLSSRKVLEIEKELVNEGKHAYWCFCVTYVEGEMPQAAKEKPDYQKVLGEAAYARFSRMREIRKRLAQEESVPAYAAISPTTTCWGWTILLRIVLEINSGFGVAIL